tara:strand:+ start:1051 stop:1278 length:228 start_codon:yes stop_codon:yes gene_type:complete
MTQTELEKRFGHICNRKHWKDEIHHFIPKELFDEYDKAVIHFTGGNLQVLSEVTFKGGSKFLEVYSEGYWHHIGS